MATPELELNEDEAKKFAGSLARVSSLYDDRINPKLVAWIDLVCVTGAIYGPRAIAISARMKQEQPQRAQPIVINTRATAGPTAGPTNKDTRPQAQAANARSPVDLFGDVFYGATIPDAQ